MVIPPTAPYRAYWRKLEQKKPTPKQRALTARARREARRLAKILAEEFGARHVYLFGSFAWLVPWVTPKSDIDLAAEGMPDGSWWDAIDRLEESTKYGVDLVRMEKAPTHLHGLILEAGIVVYDAQKTPSPHASSPRRDHKPAARAKRSRR